MIKKDAQIVINTVDNSDTNAAGETATTYNPATGHLLKATVNLNRYYLQNEWYGYSYNRIVNTAEHELGHAIGLNHTNNVSVMYQRVRSIRFNRKILKLLKRSTTKIINFKSSPLFSTIKCELFTRRKI